MRTTKKTTKIFTTILQTTITALTAAQTRFARTDMQGNISNLDAMPARKTTQSGQIQYGGTHTHKSIELWQEYIELFSHGLSLRKIVKKMNNKFKDI